MAVLIARYARSRRLVVAGGDADTSVSHLAMLRHRNMALCVLKEHRHGRLMVPVGVPAASHQGAPDFPGAMSVLMSVLGLSAAFFSFVVPRLSDRFGRRPVVVGFNLLGVVVPLAALYADGSLYLLGALIFLGWSASGTFPLFMGTIPSETIPARYVATSLGLVVGIGEIFGGVGGPYIAGTAADRYGLTAPIVMQAGLAVAGALLALALKETAPSRPPRGRRSRAPCGLSRGADDAAMSASVREAVFSLRATRPDDHLRQSGLHGAADVPRLPGRFRYVLGLQESGWWRWPTASRRRRGRAALVNSTSLSASVMRSAASSPRIATRRRSW